MPSKGTSETIEDPSLAVSAFFSMNDFMLIGSELGIQRIWPQVIVIDQFASHMPDAWINNSTKVQREFFYGVLATLAPQYVGDLIKDCRDQRHALAVSRGAGGPQQITIAPEWQQLLLAEPFISSKS